MSERTIRGRAGWIWFGMWQAIQEGDYDAANSLMDEHDELIDSLRDGAWALRGEAA